MLLWNSRAQLLEQAQECILTDGICIPAGAVGMQLQSTGGCKGGGLLEQGLAFLYCCSCGLAFFSIVDSDLA